LNPLNDQTPAPPCALRAWLPALSLAAALLTACGGGGSAGSAAAPGSSTTAARLVADGPAEIRGTVAQSVPNVPGVRLLDGQGAPIAGVSVSFRVEPAGGRVTPETIATDSDGRARPKDWVLPPSAGPSALVATAPGLAAELRLAATGEAAPPAEIAPVSEVSQVASPNGPVVDPPAVRILDDFGNPVANVKVEFSVAAGSGEVSGSPAVSGSDGVAALKAWTLGPEEDNKVVAAVAGLGEVAFTAASDGGSLRFWVETVHLNQGSQTATGDIDAVAGRGALLRVVVRASDANSVQPSVRVRLFQEGSVIREEILAAPNGGVPIKPDLAVATDTWNLVLGPEEVLPGLSVEATLDPEGDLGAEHRDGFRFPRGAGQAPLVVRSLPPLNIVFIPIRATTHGSATGNVNDDNVDSFLVATRQWLPVGAVSAAVRATPFTTDLDLTRAEDVQKLLGDLQAARTIDGAIDEYYHGIFPAVSGIAVGGMAYLAPGPGSSLRSGLSHDRLPGASAVVAHELGHNMGRRHVPCGEPANPDPDFPYQGGSIGAAGFDVVHHRLRGPVGFTDFMSYCSTNWTSDYTYEKILTWRAADTLAAGGAADTGAAPVAGASAAAASFPFPPDAPEPGVLLWGSVNARELILNPALAMEARPVVPDGDGPHQLRGMGPDGRVLFEVSFEGGEVPEADDPTARHFAWFLPLSREDAAILERVELSGPHGYVVRMTNLAGHADESEENIETTMARHEIQATRLPDGDAALSWNPERHPIAVVRDGSRGEILAIARSGQIRLAGLPPEARPELLLSDGVRSERAIPVAFH
jgi:hypothetical protein